MDVVAEVPTGTASDCFGNPDHLLTRGRLEPAPGMLAAGWNGSPCPASFPRAKITARRLPKGQIYFPQGQIHDLVTEGAERILPAVVTERP